MSETSAEQKPRKTGAVVVSMLREADQEWHSRVLAVSDSGPFWARTRSAHVFDDMEAAHEALDEWWEAERDVATRQDREISRSNRGLYLYAQIVGVNL